MRVGCDIVHIPKFSDSIRREGDTFLSRLFIPSESDGASVEHLAGWFAAKEAACKALGIPAGNWTRIHLSHADDGAPRLEIDPSLVSDTSFSLSISHDGEYAFAVVIAHSERL